jgi:hypothetical protein
MPTKTQLNNRRLKIIDKMSRIETMRKGSLNEKYNKTLNKKGEESRTGPYYVLTSKGPGNKTVSISVPVTAASRVHQDVNNYREFRRLTDEYIEVCENIAMQESDECDSKKN